MSWDNNNGEYGIFFFEVIAAGNGLRVRTTGAYWDKIVTIKHPSMLGQEEQVKRVLAAADQIRRSRTDEKVLLYYKGFGEYHVCVVVKVLNGDGFIVTTYRTENIKEGEIVWPK